MHAFCQSRIKNFIHSVWSPLPPLRKCASKHETRCKYKIQIELRAANGALASRTHNFHMMKSFHPKNGATHLKCKCGRFHKFIEFESRVRRDLI